MNVIINSILGAILGGLLGYMGFSILTWQFWAVMLIASLIIINTNNKR